ncbi:hypothetical protein SBA4_7120002 [Candidatus Sulfopaludibacter sp. SbA4]|nr:hypothetical protein SBA4_7120002 [Candidatus Sulfopaludibacter sp. SbA4]
MTVFFGGVDLGCFWGGADGDLGDLSQILAVRFSRLTAAPVFHFRRFRTGVRAPGTDTADGGRVLAAGGCFGVGGNDLGKALSVSTLGGVAPSTIFAIQRARGKPLFLSGASSVRSADFCARGPTLQGDWTPRSGNWMTRFAQSGGATRATLE